MVVFGGWGVGGVQSSRENHHQAADTLFVLDTHSMIWSIPHPSSSSTTKVQDFHKYGHTANVDHHGNIIIFGGWDGKQAVNDSAIMVINHPINNNNNNNITTASNNSYEERYFTPSA